MSKNDRMTYRTNSRYDTYEQTERAVAAQTVPTVLCDCGHRVLEGQAMLASTGSACPRCYDRMSD